MRITHRKGILASPIHLIIGLILSIITGSLTYMYLGKKYERQGRKFVLHSIVIGLATMIIYNMIMRPAGITL